MRAVQYAGGETIAVVDAEDAPPGAGEVRIAVAYTGICGTDLHILHGAMDARVRLPAVIGHEMSGVVDALGAGVDGLEPGQPVTVVPLRPCGRCPACLAGHDNVCHRLDVIGVDSPGAMQSRWTVPASLVVPLPAGLPLRRAALVEPTAVAVHDVRRAGVAPGERAVVVGAGPVGTLIALCAEQAGADVLVVEPDGFRRGVAADLGLATLDPSATEVAAAVDAWTGGAGAEVAFEVSGAAAGVATAVGALAARGRLCLVAIHPTPREVDLHRFFLRELTLVAARLYERVDFERALVLVASGAVGADALISRVVPLELAADAFALLESGGVMKVLVDCREAGA